MASHRVYILCLIPEIRTPGRKRGLFIPELLGIESPDAIEHLSAAATDRIVCGPFLSGDIDELSAFAELPEKLLLGRDQLGNERVHLIPDRGGKLILE